MRGNFFCIGIKDLRALNFTMTLKVKVNKFNDGWLGVSFRKDFNDRFNACNNNMLTLRFQPDKSIGSQGYRGYTGGSSPVTLANAKETAYRGDVSGWLNWKIEVNGAVFKSYVNDQLLGEWHYTKNANEGFISINACLFDGAVDDVAITAEGVTAPPTQTPATSASEPINPGSVPSFNGDVTKPSADSSSTNIVSTNPGENDGGFIKSIYKDVTVDNTFGVITLTRQLTAEDFLISFKLSDRYVLSLVDAQKNVVTDLKTTVTDSMGAQVTKDDKVVKMYTIAVNVDEPADGPQPTNAPNTPGNTGNTGLIVGIVVAAILVAGGGVTVLVLWKKGFFSKESA